MTPIVVIVVLVDKDNVFCGEDKKMLKMDFLSRRIHARG